MSVIKSQYNVYQQLTGCRLVSTSNVSGIYFNGTTNNGVGATLTGPSVNALTVDSVTPDVGDRLLLSAQTNTNENGIYVVVSPGSASSLWQLQRSNDFQSIEQLNAGQYLTVNDGTVNHGSAYVLCSPLPGAMGVNGIVFTSIGLSNSSSFQLKSSISANKINNVGGSTTLAITDLFVTTNSIVVADIESSANAVTIQKVTPTNHLITITFSADPGASVINYINLTASQ